MRNRLPKKNSWVRTPSGDGRVVDTQVLTQLVMVQLKDSTHEAFPLEEIKRIDGPPRGESLSEKKAPSEVKVPKKSWPKKPEPEVTQYDDLDENVLNSVLSTERTSLHAQKAAHFWRDQQDVVAWIVKFIERFPQSLYKSTNR